jgi:hypothetical protein
MKSAQCSLCNRRFSSSAYWFKMKRADFPVNCYDCRQSERERMRIELEKTGTFSTVNGGVIRQATAVQQVPY